MKVRIFLVLFFFISTYVIAQMGWWTWMHGSNNGFPPVGNGNFGTQGVASPTNDPARAYNGGDWTDLNGNFWMFGGSTPLADVLWKFDPSTNMWTWMKGPNVANSPGVYGTKGTPSAANYPGSRFQGMFTWTDNNGNLWLFGGHGNGSTNAQGFLNDLWRYNISSNQWTWMHGDSIATPSPGGSYGTQGVPSPTNIPPCRREGASAWTDKNGNLWLFGGESAFGPLGLSNDLWKYDISTNMWTWMRGSNTIGSLGSYGTKGVPSPTNDPPARRSYTHWVDTAGNLWLFGGDSYSDIYNDLWKYDVSSNMWTWVRGSNTVNPPAVYGTKCSANIINDPPARTQNKSNWVDQCGNFWMFGGRDNLGNNFNDLWHYDVARNTWTWVNGGPGSTPSHGTMNVPAATNMPEPRSNPMTFMQSNGNLWLFGGNYPPIGNNDLWRYVIDTTCIDWCSVAQNPIAGFTGTNLVGCAPLTVSFTNTSTNSTSWSWNFGDGGTSTLINPSHTYSSPGTYTVTLIAYNGTNSDTLIQNNYVTVYTSANAIFTTTNDTACINQSLTFTNNSTGATGYTWSFGDGNFSTQTNPSHSYSTAGNYTVTLIAFGNNGCNDTLAIPITVLSSSVTAAFTASPLNGCAPLNVNFTNNSTGATFYSWNFGNGQTSNSINPSTTYTNSGTYTVTLIAIVNNFCGIDSDTANNILITVHSLPLVSTGNSINVSCFGGNNGSASVSANSGSAPYIYSWTPGNFTTPSISGVTAGLYTVTVTDANGCTALHSVQITEPTALSVQFTTTSDTCSKNNGSISAAVSGGTPAYTYSWSNNGTSSTINSLPAGSYTLYISDNNNCTHAQSVNVSSAGSALINAGPDIIITSGSGTTLSATGGITYTWTPAATLSCSICVSPVATPTITTTYTVTGTASNGCTNSDTITVFVETPCYTSSLDNLLPNALSPNGDGINDILCVPSNACIINFELKIFDRWGEKIFETDSFNNCWNGNIGNNETNTAVFTFTFNAKLSTGESISKKGTISLIR